MPGKKEKAPSPLLYKGRPLVRSGGIIYFGDPKDKYIIMLQVMDTEQNKDIEVATRVLVQLQYTDPDIRTKDRVVKKIERDGLYNALDIGAVWLERAMNEK